MAHSGIWSLKHMQRNKKNSIQSEMEIEDNKNYNVIMAAKYI